MFKKVVSIRGAVVCENTKEDITKNVCNLCNLIFEKNNLKQKNIISIVFSVTEEINKINPATALRSGNLNFDCSKIALFCCQEAKIENGLKNTIRVMFTVYSKNKNKQNIYLNGAEKLRPDLTGIN